MDHDLGDDLGEVLARLRDAWMAGRPGREHCPAAWGDIINGSPGENAAIVALAGHAIRTIFRPMPGTPLVVRALLPRLTLPPVSEKLRPRLRRILAPKNAQATILRPLLNLLSARGTTIHPGDWLPGRRDDWVPPLYGPWLDWVNAGAPPRPAVSRRQARDANTEELATELAVLIEPGVTGLASQRVQIRFEPLKTAPQNARRKELLGLVNLGDLAKAIGTAEAALVETAPTGAADAIVAFAAMVAATGNEVVTRTLLTRVIEDPASPLAAISALVPRLEMDEIRAILPAVMRREEQPSLEQALAIAGAVLGEVSESALQSSPGYAALLELLDTVLSDPETKRPQAKIGLGTGLAGLGFLLDSTAAQGVIAHCVSAGLSSADPNLDILYLNTALKPEMPT